MIALERGNLLRSKKGHVMGVKGGGPSVVSTTELG
jgi:hypothetical protein